MGWDHLNALSGIIRRLRGREHRQADAAGAGRESSYDAALPERIWAEAAQTLGEVTVGPPVVTINQGNTFMVTEQDGAIRGAAELGFFAQDTRFVSEHHVTVNGRPWELHTSAKDSGDAVVYPDGTIVDPPIGLCELQG